jgi:hypothetical protein
MTTIVSLLFVCLAVTNIAVTLAIARSDAYTRNQKLIQSIVVWLLPVLGAVIIHTVYRSGRESSAKKSSHVAETNTEGEYAGQSHSAAQDP